MNRKHRLKIIHHSEGGKSTNSTQILRRVGREEKEREREGGEEAKQEASDGGLSKVKQYPKGVGRARNTLWFEMEKKRGGKE